MLEIQRTSSGKADRETPQQRPTEYVHMRLNCGFLTSVSTAVPPGHPCSLINMYEVAYVVVRKLSSGLWML